MSAHDDISDRLGFLQIDQRAKDALREIAPLVRDALPGVLGEFYTHVRKWPHTSGMFSGEPMMNMAKNKQIEHWNIILRGDFSSERASATRWRSPAESRAMG